MDSVAGGKRLLRATSRLCPTAPRNFGKRGEGGLWGCSCDSLCLCVPLHPPEALQDAAVPPGPPARGSVCVGCPGQRTLLAWESEGTSCTEVFGEETSRRIHGKRSQSPGGRAELDLRAPRCPRPGDEFAVLALVCPLQTEKKKNGSKAPFSMKCQLGARGAVKAVLGEDCRPLEPRAAPTVSVLNIAGNALGRFPCFISPFPPSFFNKRTKKKTKPQTTPRMNFTLADGCVRRP